MNTKTETFYVLKHKENETYYLDFDDSGNVVTTDAVETAYSEVNPDRLAFKLAEYESRFKNQYEIAEVVQQSIVFTTVNKYVEKVTLTVTEGIQENPIGNVVRCFFNTDFHYGVWCPQTEVEKITNKLDPSTKTSLKFKITKDEANHLISIGQTPYKKTYF